MLNSIFKNVLRSKFIRLTSVLSFFAHLSVIPLLYLIEKNSDVPGVAIILLWTGINSFCMELFYLPIVGVCLEVCPQNLEGFFMSMILLLNNFSKNIGQFFGTIIIYLFDINSADYSKIYLIILLNCIVIAVGVVILMYSHIPEKPKKKEEEETLEHLGNNYLAHINTQNSICIPRPEIKPSFATEKENITANRFNQDMIGQSQDISIN